MKIFEDKIQNKIDKIIFDNQSLLNDITNTNQNINNYFNQKQEEMENLYSIVAQNSECRKLLECEMRINVILVDLQKSLGDVIEELVKF